MASTNYGQTYTVNMPQRQTSASIPQYQQSAYNTYANLNNVANSMNTGWQNNDAMSNAKIYQNNASNYATGLVNQQTALQNKANQQIENRQKASESMFSGLMDAYQNDPMFSYLRGSITNWMENPGLSQNTLNRLYGQAQARAAADLASNQRSIAKSSAQNGLRGAQVDDAQWAAKSRSNSNLNNSLLNIDLQNEQMQQQNIGNAISAGQSLMSNYYGSLSNMAGNYSNLMTSYNPQVAQLNTYDAMQQVYSNPYYGSSYTASDPYSALTGNSTGYDPYQALLAQYY